MSATAKPFACLPMYDFAHLRPYTDRLWACLSEALRDAGFDAPEALTRGLNDEAALLEAWASPGLLLGQACGLPYVRRLRDEVALIGTPDFGLPGCPPGWYDSAVVVRADDPREGLAALKGATLAINSPNSQSGCNALLHLLLSESLGEQRFFGRVALTGAHRASIEAVASGRADLAAIDGVSWRALSPVLPEARSLRVLTRTAPAPGLPLIAAARFDAAALADAVAAGFAVLDPEAAGALGLRGFRHFAPADYDPIAERDLACRALARAHGLA